MLRSLVGAPARIIRYRFDEAMQQALLRIAWWDWRREQLAAALPDFRSSSIEAFVRKYDL